MPPESIQLDDRTAYRVAFVTFAVIIDVLITVQLNSCFPEIIPHIEIDRRCT